MQCNGNLPNGNETLDNNSTTINTALTPFQITAAITYLIFGLASICGNALVSWAMYKANLLTSGGYLTLVHYAVTDVITAFLDAFYMPLSIFLQNTLGPSFVYGFALTFAETASKIFMVFMALTRLYSVFCPLKARGRMHIMWYKKSLIIVWAISLAVSIPLWSGESVHFDLHCSCWAFNCLTFRWILIYGAVLNISVTVVIVTAYPVCFFKLLRISRVWDGNQCEGNRRRSVSLSNAHRERKVLYLFCVNGCVFVFFWLPVYLTALWKVNIPHINFVQEFARCIEISYNPFMYICLNSNIRYSVGKLLFKKKLVPKRTFISENSAATGVTKY